MKQCTSASAGQSQSGDRHSAVQSQHSQIGLLGFSGFVYFVFLNIQIGIKVIIRTVFSLSNISRSFQSIKGRKYKKKEKDSRL